MDYDPSQFPAFAVTVDVVILTMSEGLLHVLLVCRGEPPFEGMWAIPGGFKRPIETLDEAAKRELAEETGVDAASLLTQFGAYGDPERDPRMNVVTIAYLAVLRDVGAVVAGADAAAAALIPVSDLLNGKIDLAFDHLRIVRDAVERVRADLELRGIATAFVGPTFTLAELRAVYEAVWGVHFDAANFRRSVLAESGWVIPTGRRARPGSSGGKPAELYRAGRSGSRADRSGTRSQPRRGEGTNESSCPRQVRAAGRPPTRRRRAARPQGGRSPRQDPRDHGQPDRLPPSRSQPVPLAVDGRSPPTEAQDPRRRAGGRGRGGRRGRQRVRGR